MNRFKAMLLSEFGGENYYKYVCCVEEKMKPEDRECKELFDAIYRFCVGFDLTKIKEKQIKINELIMESVQVGKSFGPAMLVYLIAWFTIVASDFLPEVQLLTLFGITVVFGIKLLEYLRFRCRYADARIVETYNRVLDLLRKSKYKIS